MEPAKTLRIPVISWKPGFVEAVLGRIYAEAADVSPARALLDRGGLELIAVPIPEYPAPDSESKLAKWELTPEQEELLATAEVIIGDAHNCAALLLGRAAVLPINQQKLLANVKWVQGTYAGVERYFNRLTADSPKPSFVLTRAGGVDGMAQYALGWVVALERQLHLAVQRQKEGVYAQEELKYRSFRSLTVGVLGLGAIGQAIGKLFKVAGFHVLGFKRQLNGQDSAALNESTDEVTNDLSEVLAKSDYIVSILPSTAATKYLLTEENLELCREKRPVLINIGRGDLIAEATVIKALDSSWLSTVVLDVFEKEPLAPSSALWTHPGVRLTPHVAAFCFPEDVADVFVPNLNAYLRGEADEHMTMRVDWSAGY